VLQPPQHQALQTAPAAPPKPALDPATLGQVASDHVRPEPALANLGFDVAIGLGLILAFAVVRRFILDLIEAQRPLLEPTDANRREAR
jgi:hypothetical protein